MWSLIDSGDGDGGVYLLVVYNSNKKKDARVESIFETSYVLV